MIPTALLETRGARTGNVRRNAVIYFNDGPDTAIIVASQAGQPTHPSWYHNVVAHPEIKIGDVAALARVVANPDEQVRLWELADRVFPAFKEYRRRAKTADREIPLIALDLRTQDPN